jgi:hypothetical protein
MCKITLGCENSDPGEVIDGKKLCSKFSRDSSLLNILQEIHFAFRHEISLNYNLAHYCSILSTGTCIKHVLLVAGSKQN